MPSSPLTMSKSYTTQLNSPAWISIYVQSFHKQTPLANTCVTHNSGVIHPREGQAARQARNTDLELFAQSIPVFRSWYCGLEGDA